MYPSIKPHGVNSQKVLDLRITTLLTSSLVYIYAIKEVPLITKRDSKFVRLFTKHPARHRRTLSFIPNLGSRHQSTSQPLYFCGNRSLYPPNKTASQYGSYGETKSPLTHRKTPDHPAGVSGGLLTDTLGSLTTQIANQYNLHRTGNVSIT